MSDDWVMPWTLKEANHLDELLDAGRQGFAQDTETFGQLLEVYERLLTLRAQVDESTLDAIGAIYEQVEGNQLEALVDRLNGPEHEHVIWPLIQRLMTATSIERRMILYVLPRLEHPAACEVAEYLFLRHGEGTQILCCKIIERCGLRQHLELVERLLDERAHFSVNVFRRLSSVQAQMLETYPPAKILATPGSLSVSHAPTAQAGALSLDDAYHASSVMVGVSTKISNLLIEQAELEAQHAAHQLELARQVNSWFMLAPHGPRTLSWQARAALAWHDGPWLILYVCLLSSAYLFDPKVLPLFFVFSVVVFMGIQLQMWLVSPVLTRLESGHLVNGQLRIDREHGRYVLDFQSEDGVRKTLHVAVPRKMVKELEQKLILSNMPALWMENEGEADSVHLMHQYSALQATESGELEPRSPWIITALLLYLLVTTCYGLVNVF